jgi:hypothetical protein
MEWGSVANLGAEGASSMSVDVLLDVAKKGSLLF